MLSARAAASPYPFSVSTRKNGQRHDLVASNRGSAPVSVRVSLTAADNVRATQPLPHYAVVAPASETILLSLFPAGTTRGQRFTFQSRFSIGSYLARPDSQAVYRLPYADGLSARVGQAPGGPLTTHVSPDSRHAIDFTVPVHTPIVAARDGTIIAAESSNLFGGQQRELLAKANYVRILHADGTIATYAHLSPGGVKVAPGEWVRSGTLIGASGATGYASGPHLHFVVQRLVAGEEGFALVSLPVRFHVGDPAVVVEPTYGQVLSATYDSPASLPPAGRKPSAAH
ncbi:M23 family metallopeptidase [Accumulibacter sp.]|nr:M23 family metallopeptidase [Accumulibacter sp.]MCM8626455.1 M23 family metallopeptidase [Accumulibacter sp.]